MECINSQYSDYEESYYEAPAVEIKTNCLIPTGPSKLQDRLNRIRNISPIVPKPENKITQSETVSNVTRNSLSKTKKNSKYSNESSQLPESLSQSQINPKSIKYLLKLTRDQQFHLRYIYLRLRRNILETFTITSSPIMTKFKYILNSMPLILT